MLESDIQEFVVNYLRISYPKALYCASAGGMRTSMRQAIKMKRTGYVKGVPDLQIFEPRGGYHGLLLEIKTKKGVASLEQKVWRDLLTARGYKAEICKGTDQCIKVIDEYFNETPG
jgi:hypothetical protein